MNCKKNKPHKYSRPYILILFYTFWPSFKHFPFQNRPILSKQNEGKKLLLGRWCFLIIPNLLRDISKNTTCRVVTVKNNMNFIEAIHKLSGWKNIFFLAIILLLIIGIILPEATEYMGECLNGKKRLDMAFFYTPDDVYNCLETYGPLGRHSYIFILLTLDLIFPIFLHFIFMLHPICIIK